MTEPDLSSQSGKRPKWKQLAWMIGGGIVLAAGGCGFFLSNLGGNRGNTAGIGAFAFVIGVVLCLAGCFRGLYLLFTRRP